MKITVVAVALTMGLIASTAQAKILDKVLNGIEYGLDMDRQGTSLGIINSSSNPITVKASDIVINTASGSLSPCLILQPIMQVFGAGTTGTPVKEITVNSGGKGLFPLVGCSGQEPFIVQEEPTNIKIGQAFILGEESAQAPIATPEIPSDAQQPAQGGIYWAAPFEAVVAGTERCKHFDTPSVDEQKARLTKKYGEELKGATISTRPDGSHVFTAERHEAATNADIHYVYFDSLQACEEFQATALSGKDIPPPSQTTANSQNDNYFFGKPATADQNAPGDKITIWKADWGSGIIATLSTEPCPYTDLTNNGYQHAAYSAIPLERLNSPNDSFGTEGDHAITTRGCWFMTDDGSVHAKLKRKSDGKVFDSDIKLNDGSWTKSFIDKPSTPTPQEQHPTQAEPTSEQQKQSEAPAPIAPETAQPKQPGNTEPQPQVEPSGQAQQGGLQDIQENNVDHPKSQINLLSIAEEYGVKAFNSPQSFADFYKSSCEKLPKSSSCSAKLNICSNLIKTKCEISQGFDEKSPYELSISWEGGNDLKKNIKTLFDEKYGYRDTEIKQPDPKSEVQIYSESTEWIAENKIKIQMYKMVGVNIYGMPYNTTSITFSDIDIENPLDGKKPSPLKKVQNTRVVAEVSSEWLKKQEEKGKEINERIKNYSIYLRNVLGLEAKGFDTDNDNLFLVLLPPKDIDVSCIPLGHKDINSAYNEILTHNKNNIEVIYPPKEISKFNSTFYMFAIRLHGSNYIITDGSLGCFMTVMAISKSK